MAEIGQPRPFKPSTEKSSRCLPLTKKLVLLHDTLFAHVRSDEIIHRDDRGLPRPSFNHFNSDTGVGTFEAEEMLACRC